MSEFFDTSGLDDMEAEISAVAEGLEMAPDIIKEVLESYLPLWKTLAPRDTGRLKESIKIVASGGMYGISMNDYGWYNLYGVKPNARTPFNTLSNPRAPRRQPMPSLLKGGFYKYSNRQYGLPATIFMPQLQSEESFSRFVDEIFTIIENRIINE